VTDGPLLAAHNLVVRYRDVEAVRDVSFAVHRGEVVGLIGPDAAGKTSTLRVLGGLLRATGGHAEALGVDCWLARRASTAASATSPSASRSTATSRSTRTSSSSL